MIESQPNWYVQNFNYDRALIINFKLLLEINFNIVYSYFFEELEV